jgi:hypothetical protein
VFAHHEEEDKIYPLNLTEIADAQHQDQELKVYFKKNAKMSQTDVCPQLIEDTKVLCKNEKLIIPTSLRHMAVSWYHHYLEHPGHSCLEEMMRSMMYWKGMHTTIQRYIKTCQSCHFNKRQPKVWTPTTKAGHNDSLKSIMCNLIGPYTLKSKGGLSIDFMCLTMIGPTTSWFEIVELPTVAQATTVPPVGKGKKGNI